MDHITVSKKWEKKPFLMLKSQEDRMLTLIITVWLECLRWSLLKSIVTTAEGISQSGFNIVNSLSLSSTPITYAC